jgi:endonuclease/exonuclease/phosphatase family metal-dependent hydrolase
MQRFMAELSSPVDKAEFERSWHSDQALSSEPRVDFVFAGQRVSAVVHTEIAAQWPSASFHQTFSAAIRRLNRACNVRWL